MMVHYPTQLDEIDQWLADNFGIISGACSSTENLRHNTARMIAEALWPKCKDSLHIPETCKENGDSFTDETDSKKASGDSIKSKDLKEAAADADIHLTYDEYMKCLDAAIEEYERRDKDVYCHKTSFRWGFEAGADWQKEQDHDACYQCEKNYDTVFYKGEQHAIKMLKEEAIEGKCIDIGMAGAIIDTDYGCLYLPPESFEVGDKIKVYIFRDNKK